MDLQVGELIPLDLPNLFTIRALPRQDRTRSRQEGVSVRPCLDDEFHGFLFSRRNTAFALHEPVSAGEAGRIFFCSSR